MKTTAHYNEIEPYAVQWLKNLIDAGHIAPGTVDARSIRDLSPDDVRDAMQFHAFAGIGVWSHALRLAGWPDDLPVWTGSCPCQPFSGAGKRKGVADDRHLWPEWFRLIRECRPSFVFGEQVAGGDGLGWFDAVQADLEGEGYAVGAADLCAAGVGAPHLRQRLYFCAYADRTREQTRTHEGFTEHRGRWRTNRTDLHGATSSGLEVGACSDAECSGSGAGWTGEAHRRASLELDRHGAACIGGYPSGARLPRRPSEPSDDGAQLATAQRTGQATRGFWADCDWWPGLDGKWRPTEPGLFPLAYGAPARVGRLRAYGNAIVAPLAATFIRAAAETLFGDGGLYV